MPLQVDIISDDSITDLKPLRIQLKKALEETGHAPYWKEWKTGNGHLPAHLKKYRQPVLLVNGYPVLHRFDDAGSHNRLRTGIEKYQTRKHKNVLLIKLAGWINTILPFLVMFFPKCPMCWAAYVGFLSALGINIPYTPQLQLIFIITGLVFCTYLFIRAKRHRGYWPAILITLSLVLAILNNYFLQVNRGVFVLCLLLSLSGIVLLSSPESLYQRIRRFIAQRPLLQKTRPG